MQGPLPDSKEHSEERQTFMSPVGFKLAVPASDQLQSAALDRSATGIGGKCVIGMQNFE
jgi:hypothetical protein